MKGPTIFPTTPIGMSPVELSVKKRENDSISQLRTVKVCADTLSVWQKNKNQCFSSWKRIPFEEWRNVTAHDVDRKYYSHQKKYPLLAYFRDPIDALKIGISTFIEKVTRFFSGKDLFFLDKNIKQQAQQNVSDGIRVSQAGNEKDRGGFVKRGHAHLNLVVNDNNNNCLYVAIDPAASKLGPGYTNQLAPVIPEGLENTDVLLVSHAHLDHFVDIPLYSRKWREISKNFINRIVKRVKQAINYFRQKPVAPTESVRTRLIFPAGSEQIDTLFKSSLQDQCGNKENQVAGFPAEAFVPYSLCRQNDDRSAATLVSVPTKHWAGTNPITNFHKAPGFGYLLMTGKECIFDAGDTGYSEEMYDSVADIARTDINASNIKYVSTLFSPAGPDFNRKHMEKTHQATIDTARAMLKVQLLPFMQQKSVEGCTNKKEVLKDFMTNTECHQIHWGYYKLGPIHYEDPWICWLDLLNHMTDSKRDLKDFGNGAEDLRSSLSSSAYRKTRLDVVNDLITGKDDINGNLKLDEQWDDTDIIKVILKTIFTQVAPNHETSLGHPQHAMIANILLSRYEDIQHSQLTTKNLATWFFTHPDDRTEEQFNRLFCATE